MKLGYRFLVLAAALLGGSILASCGNEEAERQARMDSIARAKRMQDSIAQLRADSAALAQEAEEAARRQEEMEAQPVQENMKFHVIKGSFTIQTNADNFLQVQLAQYPEAKIFIAPNGYKLVSIADFDNMQSAIQMVNQLMNGSEEGAGYWVYEEGGPYNTEAWLEEKGAMDDEHGSGSYGGDDYSSDSQDSGSDTAETSDYGE